MRNSIKRAFSCALSIHRSLLSVTYNPSYPSPSSPLNGRTLLFPFFPLSHFVRRRLIPSQLERAKLHLLKYVSASHDTVLLNDHATHAVIDPKHNIQPWARLNRTMPCAIVFFNRQCLPNAPLLLRYSCWRLRFVNCLLIYFCDGRMETTMNELDSNRYTSHLFRKAYIAMHMQICRNLQPRTSVD